MKKLYNNFIGIDIGKFNFVVNIFGNKQVQEYENSQKGIDSFLKCFQNFLHQGLSIVETTGGYEMKLLLTLCKNNFAIHRANTRKVKNFIRSYGKLAKTDALDAKALALYGYERGENLDLYVPAPKNSMLLYELAQRRQDLKQMLIAEKNRQQSPGTVIKESCKRIIEILSAEAKLVTQRIDILIEENSQLKEKKEILQSVPGIGNIIANELVAFLPELGSINRRAIASLVGVAPIANDSGKSNRYRATGHGRAHIKSSLFLAAMAARNSKSSFKEFYERLINKGKKKKVALTALMRKIIIVANARVRDTIEEKNKEIFFNENIKVNYALT